MACHLFGAKPLPKLGLCIGWIELIQYVSMIHPTDTAGIVDTYRLEQNKVDI